MIVHGTVMNCISDEARIKTHDKLVDIVVSKSDLKGAPLAVQERVVAYAPGSGKGLQFRVARTPFRWICEVKKDKYCDLIAICSVFKPLAKTRGTDMLFSLVVTDQTGMIEVKVFTDQGGYDRMVETNGGVPFKRGDVLLIRNIKTGNAEGTAVVTKPFAISKIGACGTPQGPAPFGNFVEWTTCEFLKEVCTPQLPDIVRMTLTDLLNSSKTKLIKDLVDKSFFNILGKVIHCDKDELGAVTITDFTTTKLVVAGLGAFPADMVVVIKMFGRHRDKLENIEAGKYYLFENIRMHSFSPVLEAYMHDNLDGGVHSVTGEDLRDLTNREVHFYATKSAIIAAKEAHIPIFLLKETGINGVFVCNCLITHIELPRDKNDCSVVTAIEAGKAYRMNTKENLKQKLEKGMVELGVRYMCLLMRGCTKKLFMVDIFVDKAEYAHFLEVYEKIK